MRPVIGITMSYEQTPGPAGRERSYLNAAYSDSIYAAGGLPLAIAPPAHADAAVVAEYLDRCHGFLFTGGPDLDPRHYGQERHPKTEVLHPRRDAFDIALFRSVEATRKPVLSICLGCQIAGVARGGCLVQHVDDLRRPDAVEHHMPDYRAAYHDVTIAAGTRLAAIIGRERIEVNSRHHQVLDRSQVGASMRVSAVAPDGVVEAVEDPAHPFLVAVQWHPEDMIDRPEHLALFRALVAAAAENAVTRFEPTRR